MAYSCAPLPRREPYAGESLCRGLASSQDHYHPTGHKNGSCALGLQGFARVCQRNGFKNFLVQGGKLPECGFDAVPQSLSNSHRSIFLQSAARSSVKSLVTKKLRLSNNK